MQFDWRLNCSAYNNADGEIILEVRPEGRFSGGIQNAIENPKAQLFLYQ